MIFGMKVARRFKKKIESGKNWRGTIRKIIDEFTIILIAHGIEWAVLDQSGVFVLTGGVTAIVTLTELWSIIENLNTIDPKGPWQILGKFLKKKGEDYTGIELDFNNEHTDDNKVVDDQLENRS
jgi:phage-related holin